ncbi:MAG: DUF1330 domain-containing protein [Gemmatimonadota bacterium]|nr:DUF1330 domain-containing protein [Gemmatimonadota bacterium]
MPVFMIIEVEVRNIEMYSEYIEKVPGIISQYGGRYLTRGGKISPLSGNWNPERIVLIEFETIGKLQECFKSTEYLEIAPLREKSTVSKSVIVEGCISSDPC